MKSSKQNLHIPGLSESKASLAAALSTADVAEKACSLFGSSENILEASKFREETPNEQQEVDLKENEQRSQEMNADMFELKERVQKLSLSTELLKKGLSSIGRAPDSQKHVFQRLSLPVYITTF
jgi:hypothetical protein